MSKIDNQNALPVGAFLLNVYKNIEYTTPKLVTDFIYSEKMKCIIQNPPYVVR
jgi:hypothetical protein